MIPTSGWRLRWNCGMPWANTLPACESNFLSFGKKVFCHLTNHVRVEAGIDMLLLCLNWPRLERLWQNAENGWNISRSPGIALKAWWLSSLARSRAASHWLASEWTASSKSHPAPRYCGECPLMLMRRVAKETNG